MKKIVSILIMLVTRLVIGNVSLSYSDNNDIKVKRINVYKHNDLKNLSKRTYQIPFNQDLVVRGLGFIKMVYRGEIDLYLNQRVDTFLRDNLI